MTATPAVDPSNPWMGTDGWIHLPCTHTSPCRPDLNDDTLKKKKKSDYSCVSAVCTTHTCPWQSPAVAVRACNLSAAAMHATCPHVRTEATQRTTVRKGAHARSHTAQSGDPRSPRDARRPSSTILQAGRGRRAMASCLLYLVRKGSLFSCRYVSSFRGCRPAGSRIVSTSTNKLLA